MSENAEKIRCVRDLDPMFQANISKIPTKYYDSTNKNWRRGRNASDLFWNNVDLAYQVPFVVSTDGLIGCEAKNLLKLIALCLAAK
jgi:hypothetical protein